LLWVFVVLQFLIWATPTFKLFGFARAWILRVRDSAIQDTHSKRGQGPRDFRAVSVFLFLSVVCFANFSNSRMLELSVFLISRYRPSQFTGFTVSRFRNLCILRCLCFLLTWVLRMYSFAVAGFYESVCFPFVPLRICWIWIFVDLTTCGGRGFRMSRVGHCSASGWCAFWV
jgi:hypothetical protein